MFEIWYAVAVFALTAFVVLDGFDLGAGGLHYHVARDDRERRQVFAAIGPFWDANEVWLLVAGGVLFVAFPKVLASGVSGFYFAIFVLLWCLILRGVSVELRNHVPDPVWRASFDLFFWASSLLLPFFLGAALGNLLRGLPLSADGWFALPLFTDFTAREPVGILDWYTVTVGGFALAALLAHGAAYLAWRTEGAVMERSRRAARRLFVAVALLWPAVTAATVAVSGPFAAALTSRPLAWVLAAAAVAGLAAALRGSFRGRDLAAFAGSCLFLAALSAATAACVYPVMLRSSGDPARSITAAAGGGDPAGLAIALRWLAVGLPLALGYFVVVWRLHRGRVAADVERGPA